MLKIATDIDGKLVIRGGKFCIDCCASPSDCSGPEQINIGEEFEVQSCWGAYIDWTGYGDCNDEIDGNPGGPGKIFYEMGMDKYFTNPLDSNAVLKVRTELWFDTDLAVDGVSLSLSVLGVDCPVYTVIPRGTVISGVVAPGAQVHLQVIDRYGVYTGGRGCLDWIAVT